jgi:hypothetical protein
MVLNMAEPWDESHGCLELDTLESLWDSKMSKLQFCRVATKRNGCQVHPMLVFVILASVRAASPRPTVIDRSFAPDLPGFEPSSLVAAIQDDGKVIDRAAQRRRHIGHEL